jgi:hypothetical protein
LFVLGIPLLISIFATTTDEMAESGADNFRVGLAVRRMCVNAHWSLAGFYIGATRGVLFPQAPARTRDIAFILMCGSLFFGLVGAIALRRAGWLLSLIVILSAVLFVWFGTTF